MFAEERLELRIERNIGAVVVEQVELDVLVAGAIEQRLVVHPVVGADARDIPHAVGVLELWSCPGATRKPSASRLAAEPSAQ